MPYQQTGKLWSAWPRFFLMLALLLVLNTAWPFLALNIDFVKVPASQAGDDLSLAKSASETNMLIRWGLEMAFNTILLVWSLWQRHVGESVAAFIGMLWLAYLSFCFYLLVSFGYSIASMIQAIQGAKH